MPCIRSEDMKYIIRDTNTGTFYDIRIQDNTITLNKENQKLTKFIGKIEDKPWEDWWQKKREQNDKLLAATEKGEVQTVRDLLDKKQSDLVADVNVKDLDGFTPLHISASEGNIELVMYLVKAGGQVEAVSNSLRTPLHIACRRGYMEIILILIQSKANLNAQDINGNTPIHFLSEGRWAEALEITLNYNPDITLKNSYGETAVEVAANIKIRKIFDEYIKRIEMKKKRERLR